MHCQAKRVGSGGVCGEPENVHPTQRHLGSKFFKKTLCLAKQNISGMVITLEDLLFMTSAKEKGSRP